MQRYGGLRAAPACSFWFCRCSGRGGRSHLPGAVLLGFDGNPSRRGQRTRVRRANRRTADMPRWRQQGPIMRLVCTLGLMGTDLRSDLVALEWISARHSARPQVRDLGRAVLANSEQLVRRSADNRHSQTIGSASEAPLQRMQRPRQRRQRQVRVRGSMSHPRWLRQRQDRASGRWRTPP